MGAGYWATASVRLLAEDGEELALPPSLTELGESNDRRTVWFRDNLLPDDQPLQAQFAVAEVELFLEEHRQHLAEVGARVNILAGWGPDSEEQVVIGLPVLEIIRRLDGDLIIDVHNSDPRFVDEDDDTRRYWSRLSLATASLTGNPDVVLIDDDDRRTADLAAHWIHALANYDPDGVSVPDRWRRLILEWEPADQDGLVLTRHLLDQLVRRGMEFVVRVNNPARRSVPRNDLGQPLLVEQSR